MIFGKTKSGWYRVWEAYGLQFCVTGTSFGIVDIRRSRWFVYVTPFAWAWKTVKAGGTTCRTFGPIIVYHNPFAR